MQILKADFLILDLLFESCEIDYTDLKKSDIDKAFFTEYSNQRVVNSFLFNYIKIQDKIGAKVFKNLLYELKEISDYSMPMIDVLNTLEKMNIIESADDWDRLREIRNNITHDYPADIEERIENINLALEGYEMLKKIFIRIKDYSVSRGLLG